MIDLNQEYNDSGMDNGHANEHPPIKREKRTFEAMIQIYCRHYHDHPTRALFRFDNIIDR